MSTLLLASTSSGMESMQKEGLLPKAVLVGDPMYGAFLQYSEKMHREEIQLKAFDGNICTVPEVYYYLTCHREENTKEDQTLLEIFNAMEELDAPVIYPVHPRNKERAKRLQKDYMFKNIILVEPVRYLESLSLVKNAKKLLQILADCREKLFLHKKMCNDFRFCVLAKDNGGWKKSIS